MSEIEIIKAPPKCEDGTIKHRWEFRLHEDFRDRHNPKISVTEYACAACGITKVLTLFRRTGTEITYRMPEAGG